MGRLAATSPHPQVEIACAKAAVRKSRNAAGLHARGPTRVLLIQHRIVIERARKARRRERDTDADRRISHPDQAQSRRSSPPARARGSLLQITRDTANASLGSLSVLLNQLNYLTSSCSRGHRQPRYVGRADHGSRTSESGLFRSHKGTDPAAARSAVKIVDLSRDGGE